MGDQDLQSHTRTGVGLSQGQRHKAQAEVSRSPRDRCVCSCVVGCGQFPGHTLLGGARCPGLHADYPQRSTPALPLLAVQVGPQR